MYIISVYKMVTQCNINSTVICNTSRITSDIQYKMKLIINTLMDLQQTLNVHAQNTI